MMTTAITGLGAFLGLLLGSFANVVIARVPEGKSVVFPPSACPQCGYHISWRDNIPVLSFALLGGRCRQCAQPISRRYPLVEAAMAALFALFGWWCATTDNLYVLPGVWTFVFASVCLFVIDIDTFPSPTPSPTPLPWPWWCSWVGPPSSMVRATGCTRWPLAPCSWRAFSLW